MENSLIQNSTIGASLLFMYGIMLFLLNVVVYRLIAL
jgi:hypothetical protein